MKMIHPEIQASGEVVNLDAFRQVYAPRGWLLMDEATEFANVHLGRFVRDATAETAVAGGLTKDEARALIATKGGDYPEADATEAEVLETYLGMFGARRPRPAPATESPTGVPIKLYDPAEHPVNESSDGSDKGVLAYLESVDTDEQLRVIEAEEKGKDRPSITGWTPPDPDASNESAQAEGTEN